ncbi:cyclic AMP-dependent transcription factor ATF-3 isoform X1 [Terrapene carolina triunguis]|uniref:Activating transcription factor 3 n=4 Tax=Testudinoidea TaxID=8486 RepID=A0A674HX21_9SAUR|nr:cyclic AMP-dependent transcription factor ATF-3 isoform X1 [Terrapene carolina triunguis]
MCVYTYMYTYINSVRMSSQPMQKIYRDWFIVMKMQLSSVKSVWLVKIIERLFNVFILFLFSKMMLQNPGQVSASEVSASAIVPCLSPTASLGFEDFTNLTPLVKEELRFAIQNKCLSHRMSSTLDTVTVLERPVEMSVLKAEFSPQEDERKKRRRERNKIAAAKCRNKKKEKTECLQKESEKLETINAELKAQIEELKNEKQHLIYMLNLHRPTCIVRAQNGRTPEDERNLFIQQIKEGTLQG